MKRIFGLGAGLGGLPNALEMRKLHKTSESQWVQTEWMAFTDNP
jgi:hypothetical protein